MKKLSLLLPMCMVSMLAFGQTDSATNQTQQEFSQESPSNVTLSPSTWGFGNVAVDFAYYEVFTLKNGGSNNITISKIVAAPSPPFSVSSTTCGGLLLRGGKCSITVQIEANKTGSKQGTLTVTTSAGSPQSIMTATAVDDATLTTYNGCQEFGNVKVGQSSKPCPVTLTNDEPTILNISGIAIYDDPPFEISSTTCGNSLPALGSCTINVVFTPQQSGGYDGTLLVTDDSPDGTPPALQFQGEGYDCRSPKGAGCSP